MDVGNLPVGKAADNGPVRLAVLCITATAALAFVGSMIAMLFMHVP